MNKETKNFEEEKYFTFGDIRIRFWAGVFVGILISFAFFLTINYIAP